MIGPHRPRDVLDRLLTNIDIADRQLAVDLAGDAVGLLERLDRRARVLSRDRDVSRACQVCTKKRNLKQSLFGQKPELHWDVRKHYRRIHIAQVVRCENVARVRVNLRNTLDRHPHSGKQQQGPRPHPGYFNLRPPRRIKQRDYEADRSEEDG